MNRKQLRSQKDACGNSHGERSRGQPPDERFSQKFRAKRIFRDELDQKYSRKQKDCQVDDVSHSHRQIRPIRGTREKSRGSGGKPYRQKNAQIKTAVSRHRQNFLPKVPLRRLIDDVVAERFVVLSDDVPHRIAPLFSVEKHIGDITAYPFLTKKCDIRRTQIHYDICQNRPVFVSQLLFQQIILPQQFSRLLIHLKLLPHSSFPSHLSA